MPSLMREEKEEVNNETFLKVKNLNKILSYENITSEVWDDYENEKINALKTTIKNLRKKLPDATILNIYGIGYKLIIKK